MERGCLTEDFGTAKDGIRKSEGRGIGEVHGAYGEGFTSGNTHLSSLEESDKLMTGSSPYENRILRIDQEILILVRVYKSSKSTSIFNVRMRVSVVWL